MAQERLSMRKIREVLRLRADGLLQPIRMLGEVFAPAHYSRYGTRQGFSITGAGLVVPNLSDFTHPNLFAYFDTSYSRRVSDSLDLSVGLTYTFSPTAANAKPDTLQFQYLHAESKSWLPPSEDNLVPDQNLSGHNVMVTVKGKFQWW